jgi:hypothetical protein
MNVPSPRQNRVDPWSHLAATPIRGQLMGNRGCLHNDAGRIVREVQVTRWIICLLEFRGRQRTVMQPGHYTELFFLDEATALAAGHRPCAECQRARYNLYREFWAKTHGNPVHPHASEMDAQLHAARWQDGRKMTYIARMGDLPAGTMVAALDDDAPHLLWQGQLWRWDFSGYTPGAQVWSRNAATGNAAGTLWVPGGISGVGQQRQSASKDAGVPGTARLSPTTEVRVLTPRPTVAILAAGYPVQVHSSLSALSDAS